MSNFNKTYTIPKKKGRTDMTDIDPSQKDQNDSVIIIPDTPSPVFSRFAGKRDRITETEKNEVVFNTRQNKMNNSNKNIESISSIKTHDRSSRTSTNQTGSKRSEVTEDSRMAEQERLAKIKFDYYWGQLQDMQDHICCSACTSNQGSITCRSHKTRSNEIDMSEEARKADDNMIAQAMFDQYWGSLANHPKYNEYVIDNDQDSCSLKHGKDTFNHDQSNALTSRNETDKYKTKSETDTTKARKFKDFEKGANIDKFRSKNNSSLGMDDQFKTNNCTDTSSGNVPHKFCHLNTERDRKVNRRFESSDSLSDDFTDLPSTSSNPPKRTRRGPSPKKFRFANLNWPSDSDTSSGSEDELDSKSLKQCLGNRSLKKNNRPPKNSQVLKVGEPSCSGFSTADGKSSHPSQKPKNIVSSKRVKNKHFNVPKLSSRSSTITRNMKSGGSEHDENSINQDNAQVSGSNRRDETTGIAGASSISPIIPEIDNSLIDMPSPQDRIIDDQAVNVPDIDSSFSPIELPQDSTSPYRRLSYISARLPVPSSMRRGRHVHKRSRNRQDDISVLIVEPTVPSPRDPSLSPHLPRTRSSRRNSGRPVRSVNNSRDSLPSHGSEFTTASSLLTPRSSGVAQQQNDEEFARRLQEEMDMEFALSLHNMENQSGHTNTVEGAAPGTNPSIPDSESENRGQGARPRMYGLQDLEAFIHHPDSSPSTLELLRHTMTTTPPRPRARQRGSRRQRTHNHLEALGRMEAQLMNILDDYRSPASMNLSRRGRRYFPTVTTPTGDGHDYEELLQLADILGEVKQKGLTKNQVTKLPERKYQLVAGEDAKDCHICMCEFEDKELLRILPCFHEFHTPCIDKWIIENATCPVCRVQVKV